MDSAVPGANNLTEFVDSTETIYFSGSVFYKERLLVTLRDGKKLFGILRSYDQFGNLTLEDTIERLYVDLEYAEDHLGVFLVRGENIVLDEEEFKSISRRMSRFRRPLDQLLPQYKRVKRLDIETRTLYYELGATDMAELDAY